MKPALPIPFPCSESNAESNASPRRKSCPPPLAQIGDEPTTIWRTISFLLRNDQHSEFLDHPQRQLDFKRIPSLSLSLL